MITGIGVVSPVGNSAGEFCDALKNGRDGVGPLTAVSENRSVHKLACEVKGFNVPPWLDPAMARRLDRASLYVLAAVDQALLDARLVSSLQDQSMGAVILGTTLGGMISGERYYRRLRAGRRSPTLLLDFPGNSATDQVAVRHGISGPALTLSTACSTGLNSLGYAREWIQTGRADFVITGGHDTMAELTLAGFAAAGCITRDRTRPFDKNRSGFLLGEGCGIFIFEERERAIQRGCPLYAEVLGYGASTDAYHMTAPDREGDGAARAMREALLDARTEPGEIDYISAHGTATRANDLAETKAIKAVFGDAAHAIPVSSIKPMIGHTLGASGTLGAIASVLSAARGFVPPTLNLETPDPHCDLDYVPHRARCGVFENVMCNAFGFGGNNASMVFRVAERRVK
jgi:3-oxoacyl-[acyl-carrier-protein] synthase II